MRGIRVVSVERGHDPRQCTLVPFGGAGPMHGTPVARELQIGRLIVPPAPGILCALGQLLADLRHDLVETHIFPYAPGNAARASAIAQRLGDAADRLLAADGVPPDRRSIEVRVEARYVGQSYELPIAFRHSDADGWACLAGDFHAAHRNRFGHADPDAPIEIVAFGATAIGKVDTPELPILATGGPTPPAAAQASTRDVFFEGEAIGEAGGWVSARIFDARQAARGQRGRGAGRDRGGIRDHGALSRRSRARSPQRRAARGVRAMKDQADRFDPITLEVLRNALEATAQEMGGVLKLTSFSPNIKERMDASCAIFDAKAQLVAQAEHVPIHLGSMLKAVGPTIAAVGALDPGDVVIVNDPFVGGAHLPDITLVAPVHAGDALIGYVATRAHHSDVGGMEPGSMPGKSSEIYQEGIVIPPVRLYRRGELQGDVLRLILANVRTATERRGDLNAQLAAIRIGERRLGELAQRYGVRVLAEGFDAILDYAERRMRNRIAELPPGTYFAEDCLDDDGSSDEPVLVKLRVEVAGDRLTLDFAGSSAQRRGNINAVAPMTHSAVFFAVKVLTDATIPANAGILRPVTILIPPGSFLDAQPPAAVCAGNTETSQRVSDTVLKAFAELAPARIPAASQGTMNLIGVGGIDPRSGRSYTYIETIAGGQGGRPGGDGMDGVQCNMTNTMNTPVEALEISYPLRVERYELREGSGGAGQHRGGHGVVRSLTVIDHDARVSLQSDRRRFAPYGLHGGLDGTTGRNWMRDREGNVRELPGKVSLTLRAGETVGVETPGGGGWGGKRQEGAATKRARRLL